MMNRISQSGFALLYSVIVISLILTIAISISNVTYKQTILSGLARDSQIAFYQADAGVECGLFYDVARGMFPQGTLLVNAPSTIDCGGKLLKIDDTASSDDYFVYVLEGSTEPCYTIVLDKTDLALGISSVIRAFGHNICTPGPRQVERALEVRY